MATYNGTNGNNTYAGGAGDDDIRGNNGNDTLSGGAGNDTISGGNDNDLLSGDAGNDVIDGDNGNDTIDGGSGNDTIDGGSGNDTINGGSGNDSIFSGGGNDTIDGGDGNDTVQGSSGGDQLRLTAVESVDSGNGSDRITVTDSTAMQIVLGAGDDVLTFLAAANATVAASSDTDTINGSAFGDTIQISNTGQIIEYIDLGDGNDTLNEQANSSALITVLGGAGDDLLMITSDASVSGGSGDDTIQFTSPANEKATVSGGAGNDTVQGTVGSDTLALTTVEQLDAGGGNDQVTADGALSSATLGAGNDELTFTAAANATVDGGSGNDTVNGSSAADALTVTDVERIDLGAGNDTLTVSAAHASVTAGDGNDRVQGGTGNQTINGGNGTDTISGGAGADVLTGGSGNDHFVYAQASESPSGASDTITDFASGDRIDLSAFDGPSDLPFNGTTAAAGKVWYEQTGGNTLVHYGTGAGHLVIQLNGLHTLTVADFIGVVVANTAPVTANATNSGSEDAGTITGSVAGFATDADGDALTYEAVGTLPEGVSLLANGSYSYVLPAALQALDDGESTQIQFSYRASDGTEFSNTSTVTITINGANDAPTVANGSVSGGEDDVAIAGSVAGLATDVDVETLTFSTVGLVPAGVTLNANGSYSYQVQASDQSLAAGESRDVVFQYVANDGTVNSNTGTVTITVNGANDAPVIAETANATTDEDVAVSGVAGASDVDTSNVLAYTASNGAIGTVSINGLTGHWTYTPTANLHGTDSFTITVTDGLVSDTQTVSVTVNSVPDVTDLTWYGVNPASQTAVPQVGDVVAHLDVLPEGFVYRAVGGSVFLVSPTGEVTLGQVLAPDQSYSVTFEVVLSANGEVEYSETFTLSTGVDGATPQTGDAALDSVIYGLAGNDSINGQAGNDVLYGQAGDDVLNGGAGNDQLFGGAGNDTYQFALDAGHDVIDEGGAGSTSDRIVILAAGTEIQSLGANVDGGVVTLSFNNSSVQFAQTAGNEIELVQFSGGSFVGMSLMTQTYFLRTGGVGTSGRDVMVGSDGNDTLSGGNSTDLLFGGAGNDSLHGGSANDIIIGGAGDDIIDAGGIYDADIIAYLDIDSGHDTIRNFDANPAGSMRDKIDLDRLFDSLGFSDADRAYGFGVIIDGNSVYIDADNDNSTGDFGGFEYHLATVQVVSGTFDQQSINVGFL